MSLIVTIPDCEKFFEAYPRIFVFVNAMTSVACVGNILMNLVLR